MPTRTLLALLLLALAAPVYAQPSGWTTYHTGNAALPSNTVTRLAASASGTLWAATDAGLARFDGATWTAFVPTPDGLPAGRLTDLAADAAGGLWAAVERTGLVHFDGQQWTTYASGTGGLPSAPPRHVAVDASGAVWVVTDEVLLHFDGAAWTVYDSGNSPIAAGSLLHAMTVAPSGAVWVWTGPRTFVPDGGPRGETRLLRLQEGSWTSFDVPADLRYEGPGGTTTALAVDAEGILWAYLQPSPVPVLARFDGAAWTTHAANPMDTFLTGLQPLLAVDASGLLWTATKGIRRLDAAGWAVLDRGGLSAFDGAQWRRFDTSNAGLPSNELSALAVAADGAVWVGTEQAGLARFAYDTPLAEPLPTRPELTAPVPGDRAAPLTPVLKWAAGANVDAYDLQIAPDTTFGQPAVDLRGLAAASGVPAVEQAHALSPALAATTTYFWRVRGVNTQGAGAWSTTQAFTTTAAPPGGWTAYQTGNAALPSNTVTHLAASPSGTLWAATDAGLARFDGTAWTAFVPTPGGLPTAPLFDLAADPAGGVWLATGEAGLVHYDGTRWATYEPEAGGLPAMPVRHVAVDAAGVVWAATPEALLRFDGSEWTRYDQTSGALPGGTMYDLAVQPDGTVWVITLSPNPFASGSSALTRFDGAAWESYSFSVPGTPAYVPHLSVDGGGRAWFVASEAGPGFLLRFDDGAWTSLPSVHTAYLPGLVTALTAAPDGTLWAASNGMRQTDAGGTVVLDPGGLSRFDGTTWRRFDATNAGLPSPRITALAATAAGDLWVATDDQGLARLSGAATVAPAPTVPAALQPSRGESGVSRTPLFTWFPSVNAETYDLQVAPGGDFSRPILDRTGLAPSGGMEEQLFSPLRLQAGTAYAWRVRAVNAEGAGGWSEAPAFTTTTTEAPGWTVYHPSNSGLPGGRIDGVAVDGRGDGWALTDQGLARFSGGRWTPVPEAAYGLPGARLDRLAVEANGTLWAVAASPAGAYVLLRFDGAAWTRFDDVLAGARRVNDLAADPRGGLWLATDAGLHHYDGAAWTRFGPGDGLPGDEAVRVAAGAGGRVWAIVMGVPYYPVLVAFDGAAWAVVEGAPLSSLDLAEALAAGPEGELYVLHAWPGTTAVSRYDGTGWTSRSREGTFTTMAVDRQGRVWAGSPFAGLARLDETGWSTFDTGNSGLPSNTIRALAVAPEGAVWIGTAGSGLALFDNPTGAPLPSIPPLLLPQAEAVDVSILPRLQWFVTAGATSYDLQVAATPAFDTPVADVRAIAASPRAFPQSEAYVLAAPLDHGTPYYWRVRAVNAGGAGDWSRVRRFTTFHGVTERQTLDAGDPPPTTFAEAGALLDLAVLDTATTVVVDRFAAAPAALPDRYTPAVDAYWRLALHGDTTFVADACFSLAALPAAHGSAALRLFARADAATPWALVPSERRGPGGAYLCTPHVERPGDFAVAVGASGVATEAGAGVPAAYALAQNYPNPFNPVTTIPFALPHPGPATLTVYDATGRRVAVLVDGLLAAGHHDVRWDARALPSGIYLYTLRSGTFTATRRLVLLK